MPGSNEVKLTREIHKRIVALIREAGELGRQVGIDNIVQPGLVKELIVAEALGHAPIVSKKGADACDPNDPSVLYEYLTCKEGGNGQIARMAKDDVDKRAKSLERILRNKKIYLAIFYEADQTKLKTIYELDPILVANEANRQIDGSKNEEHVQFGIGEPWALKNGEIVFAGSPN